MTSPAACRSRPYETGRGRQRLRRALGVALLALAVLPGCASGPLLERAIRARGGPLERLVQVSEVDVYAGFPGRWRWRIARQAPDLFAWTVYTTGEPIHHVLDGTVVRAYVGGALTAEDASPTAPLRTQARFTAVALLDALRAPGVQVRPFGIDDAPAAADADCPRGMHVRFPDGTAYRVCLDARLLVARVDGPVDLSPIGRGMVSVFYDDVRRVDGFALPRRARWTLDGALLADECVVRLCPEPPDLTPEAFRVPTRLPECERALSAAPCLSNAVPPR